LHAGKLGGIGRETKRLIFIRILLHDILDAVVIRKLFGRHRLAYVGIHFWNLPFPVFNMAVGEGKIAAPIMAV